ncbi:MAG TPA: N-acetylmuramoyl-L-alanine amidase [Solirubrobacteraceae bacterium]|nr:N-acetylmuramoyl-L-alanine amidase [Solirubrobacteraceae bacterium]
MAAPRLTRRSLVLAAGGALAGRVALPASALAALIETPRPELSERPLGTLAAGVRTIALRRNADLLGLGWSGVLDARVQLRFRDEAGRWSPWALASSSAHGPDAVAHGADASRADTGSVGEPIWTGGTRLVQLRSNRSLAGAVLHAVDTSEGLGAGVLARASERSPLARLATASLPLASPQLRAGPGQPAIVARAAWARGHAPPKVAPEYGAVRLAFVHHTENPNGYRAGEVPAMLRAIFAFHRYIRGWNDIGYNFVIDAFGRIFEARAGGIDEPVSGAQAGGYNLVSTGVAVLGSFSARPISLPARRALTRLLAWKLALHGMPASGRVTVRVNPEGAIYSRYPADALVPLPHISGHRDGDSTDCPGDALYHELPGVRASVARLTPKPVRASLTLSVAEGVTSPVQAPPGAAQPAIERAATPAAPVATPTLSGTLAQLDGTPLAGASVAIQQRRVARRGELVQEQTLAEVTTDPAGHWSLPVVIGPPSLGAGTIALRALYLGATAGAGGPTGAGAAVSEPLSLSASSLAPQPPTAQPPAMQPSAPVP